MSSLPSSLKILVTGGCGFIGSNLVRFLISQGHSVLNIDKLTYAGNPTSLSDLEDEPAYRFLKADICDSSAMTGAMAQFQPDAIMHLAAESHVDRSIAGPMDFVRTNVVGTVSLLQAATDYWKASATKDFRFLHVSTDEVYGSLGKDGLFTEKSAYSPRSPYSASKASSDHFVRAWHTTYGLPVILTNCANNYGPYQFPEKLIPVVIVNALLGKPIPVYGNGEHIREWIYVADHVEALLEVVLRGRIGETYGIGGESEMSNIEIVRILCTLLEETGCEPKSGNSFADQITFVDDRPGHDFRYALDPSKIRDELGWTPQQNHHSGLRQTVRWYLDHQSWWEPLLPDS